MRARAATIRAARPPTSRSSRAIIMGARRRAPMRCSPPASRAWSQRCAIPNPAAARGADRLRAAGVEVDIGVLERRGARAQSGWIKRMTRGRPWVRLKIAASLDGRTALAERQQPVDHRRRGARRRPPVARARLRDPHRHRHGAAGRSATDRARGRDAAPAAEGRRRSPRRDCRRRRACSPSGEALVFTAVRPRRRLARQRRDPACCPTATAASISARCSTRWARAASTRCTSRQARKLNGALLAAGAGRRTAALRRAVPARRSRARHVRPAGAARPISPIACRCACAASPRSARTGASSRASPDPGRADVHRHRAGRRTHRRGRSRSADGLRLRVDAASLDRCATSRSATASR